MCFLVRGPKYQLLLSHIPLLVQSLAHCQCELGTQALKKLSFKWEISKTHKTIVTTYYGKHTYRSTYITHEEIKCAVVIAIYVD